MSWETALTILAVAVALGADSFSLCLGISMAAGASAAYRRVFVLVVTVWHVVMPLLGLKIGQLVGNYLGRFASYIGAAILLYIAWHMGKEAWVNRKKVMSFTQARQEIDKKDGIKIDSWPALLILSLSVSMDALTVGFSLGTMKVPVLITAFIIGITAGLMTAVGFISGRLASRAVGDKARVLGAVILVVLAVKMIV